MAHDLISIMVDGRTLDCEPGTRLLDALRTAGAVVPTLCHDQRLTPYGGCRMCVVERKDGRGGLVASCSSPVERGMVIATGSPQVIDARRRQLQLILLNHRMECPVCERHGDCRLQDLVFEYGVSEEQLPFRRPSIPSDGRTIIRRDPEKCILCGRCVRICDEFRGVSAIGVLDRGLAAHVSTWRGEPLDCEFCGECVDACPVGALVAQPAGLTVPAWQRDSVRTTCSFCSCGCELDIESHNGILQQVRTVIDRGSPCVKGRFGLDTLAAPDRLRRPLVRRDGRLVETTWQDALDTVASAARATLAAGRETVGLGSSRLTSEDAYVFQRFVRGVMGSPHVDSGPGGGIDALADGMASIMGRPASTADFDDLRAADVVLVLRGDPARSHPAAKVALIGALRRGHTVILAHALSGPLERNATARLVVKPGTEDVLLRGLANLATGGRDDAVAGSAAWRSSIEPFTVAAVAAATGGDAATIKALARTVREAGRVVLLLVTGRGIPGDESSAARAACELVAALGHPPGTGSGVLVLGEKANTHGVVHAGLHPALLPGGAPVGSPEAREACARLWGAAPPDGPGWTAREAMTAMAEGRVGLLYVAGRDGSQALAGLGAARDASPAPVKVVVHDAFLSETAKLADVVLPVRILVERDGHVTAADGTEHVLQRALSSSAGLPSDGDLFREVGHRLGCELPDDAQAWAELGALAEAAPQATLTLAPVPPPPPARHDEGLLLDSAPQLFHSGTTTLHSRTLQQIAPAVSAGLAPADARRLGIESAGMVRLTNGSRSVILRAQVAAEVRAGTVMALWTAGSDGSSTLVGHDEVPTMVDVRRSQ